MLFLFVKSELYHIYVVAFPTLCPKYLQDLWAHSSMEEKEGALLLTFLLLCFREKKRRKEAIHFPYNVIHPFSSFPSCAHD